MVHGHKDCKNFCTDCKQDCKCDWCNACHFCTQRNGDRVSNYSNSSHRHDCLESLVQSDEEQNDAESHSRLNSFFEYLISDNYTVVIGTGDKATRFHVHKEPLREASRYFNCLFNFNADGEKNEVVLDTTVDIPAAFACFAQFAYFGNYSLSRPASERNILQHAEIYVLAERLEALDLKDLAWKKATALFVSLSKSVNNIPVSTATRRTISTIPEVIRIIYDSTPETSLAVESNKDQQSVKKDDHAKGKGAQKPKDDGVDEDKTEKEVGKFIAESSRDPFRVLISRFCATTLSMLKSSSSFMECVSDIPDFAQDLIKNVQDGRALEVDAFGTLKDS